MANSDKFVSKLATHRFLGYLESQRAAITGESGAHTARPELVALHGYDTKCAMHALRLGIQGIELLTTARITMPVPEPEVSLLRSIRRGELPLVEILERIANAEAQLRALATTSSVPDQPDRSWVDDWLHRAHQEHWSNTEPSIVEA